MSIRSFATKNVPDDECQCDKATSITCWAGYKYYHHYHWSRRDSEKCELRQDGILSESRITSKRHQTSLASSRRTKNCTSVEKNWEKIRENLILVHNVLCTSSTSSLSAIKWHILPALNSPLTPAMSTRVTSDSSTTKRSETFRVWQVWQWPSRILSPLGNSKQISSKETLALSTGQGHFKIN